jgi:hypothetical protein
MADSGENSNEPSGSMKDEEFDQSGDSQLLHATNYTENETWKLHCVIKIKNRLHIKSTTQRYTITLSKT